MMRERRRLRRILEEWEEIRSDTESMPGVTRILLEDREAEDREH